MKSEKSRPLEINAVLFDLDGTLLDSMPYHVRAWKEAFARYGYYPDELEFYLNEGVRHDVTVRDRLRNLGVVNPDPKMVTDIFETKREIFSKIVEMRPLEGALELLTMLRGKVKLGVVTGGVSAVVERVVAELFKGYLDVIVAYESTVRGKPDPDPYDYAIEKMDVPRQRILAVENAPTGIASALGAGLTCWAVCTTLSPRYLSQAHRIFENLHDLGEVLTRDMQLKMPE